MKQVLGKKYRMLLTCFCLFLLTFTIFIEGGIAFPQQASALNNGLAATPPMGWNSWNKYGCNINETLIKNMADNMVSSGMKDAGYTYINMDDCWQTGRDSNGNIIADPVKFPSGIKALADYVHSKGLKFGLYTDVGTYTCAGRPGSLNYETKDANTYAQWGVDYVKEDWCYTDGLDPQTQYSKMRDALSNTGRSILFSICNWGVNKPWIWGPSTGNMWRTTGDIEDSWNSITSLIDQNAAHAGYAGPGGWNDPDMLMVGNYGTGAIGGGGMTDTEYQSHFSIWAMMAAPLIAGNDLGNMNQATKDILMNKEVIAVDQDPKGVQGVVVSDKGGLQVWSKELSASGTRAIALFNRTGTAANITVNFAQVGLNSSVSVRDLWQHADKGQFNGSYTAMVPSHGVVMLKLTGQESQASGLVSGKTYKLTAKSSGKAVVVHNASTSNGANVIQWDYNASINDQWVLVDLGQGIWKVVNKLSGKAMVVKDASTADAANVIQWDYNASVNDQWIITPVGGGYYKFINKLSGKALNIFENGMENGAQMIQWPYANNANDNMNMEFLLTQLD